MSEALLSPQHVQQLVKYEEMCRAIDSVYEVDEIKDIRDKAYAMEAYFRQAKNPEPERRACEIRLRAERRAGQLLAEMDKSPAGRPAIISSAELQIKDPTLEELGITRDQSSKWQQLAKVPQDDFDAALAAPNKPSTSGILASTKPATPPMNPHALWLWGRLRDFEREGLLQINPSELLQEMTDGMRADVLRLAPLVSDWLIYVKGELKW